MSHLRTFECPNCAAPLTHAGSDKEIKCPSCGSTVIVPKDLRDKPAPTPPPPINQGAIVLPQVSFPKQGVDPSNLMSALKSAHAAGEISEADFQQKRTEILAIFSNQTLSPAVRIKLLKELRNSDGINDGHFNKMRSTILAELNRPDMNPDDKLKLLTELRNTGGITQSEFLQKRAALLKQT